MKKNNKGFTLAELLIVVAIIAVLVAISIPMFAGQLTKARESTNQANVRAAEAAAVADYLGDKDHKDSQQYEYDVASGTVKDATFTASSLTKVAAITDVTGTTIENIYVEVSEANGAVAYVKYKS